MSFGGFVRRSAYWTVDFFKGRPVGRYFSDIRDINTDEKHGKEKQKRHLDALLRFASENSDFYKGKGTELSAYPVVNKLILTENREKVKVDLKHLPWQRNTEMHVHRTSGSTGVPFAVYQDVRKRNCHVAALKYYGEIAGFKSHERLAQCRIWNVLRGKSKMQSFRENILPINISVMNDEVLEGLCRTMHEKKVVALLGYGGWMEAFSQYLKEHPQKFKHLKVIFSSAEMLKENVREDLKSQLGCDVVERYANEEEGILGQQTANSTCYYLNHANFYFELLKLDSDEPCSYGELGRIVVTDLFNYAFPMIRYDTGDVGIMSEPDKDSYGYPVLSKLYGRMVDVVYSTSGTALNPLSFSTIFKSFDFIRQWQLAQTDEKKYVARLSTKYAHTAEDEEKLIGYIKGVFGADAEVSVLILDEIPTLRSGKRKPVVCEWKREN